MLKTVSTYINVIGALVYKGTWDAATNSPTLTSSVGDKGDYYVVSQAGSTNLNGITDWQVNDIAVFNGAVWQKIDNTDAVLSVNGQTGVVVLTAPDVGATPNTAFVLAGTGMSGGGQLTGNVTLNLANTAVAAGSYGSATQVSQVTIDAQGRITSAANVTIAISTTNVSGLGTMATQNANSVTITGGSVDNTTLANATINSGVVNNVSQSNVTISSGSVTANVISANVNLTGTTAATATFATSELPLVPEGYITVQIGGVNKKIPYYGV